jgi:hypothetical protein
VSLVAPELFQDERYLALYTASETVSLVQCYKSWIQGSSNMVRIAIIHHRFELEGTGYIEIVPGKYQQKHWQEGSLFFDEETFGFIEPIFEKHMTGYDHYDMNDGSKQQWLEILNELEELNELLNLATEFESVLGKVGFIFSGTRDRFQTHFEESKKSLIEMNKEFISWVREAIKIHDHIAVLGI